MHIILLCKLVSNWRSVYCDWNVNRLHDKMCRTPRLQALNKISYDRTRFRGRAGEFAKWTRRESSGTLGVTIMATRVLVSCGNPVPGCIQR